LSVILLILIAASADPSRWLAGRTVAAAATEQLDSWIVTNDARRETLLTRRLPSQYIEPSCPLI
jgi:hypothetical protein